MELSLELDRIKADTGIIQGMLETIANSGEKREYLDAAREAGTRIIDSCERLAKRTKVVSPQNDPVLSEADGCQDDNDDKESLLKQSERVGEARMPFGKHKGTRIKEVPLSYLCWLLGLKQVGREFERVPMDKHGWVVSNHAETMGQVKLYLTWRCWACRACDVRFKFSRLCSDCWHHAGP
jgi:hypothetical protein